MSRTHDRYGSPMRKVVGIVTRRTQTYRYWVKLECGHETSYTVSGDRERAGTAQHVKTTACFQCRNEGRDAREPDYRRKS